MRNFSIIFTFLCLVSVSCSIQKPMPLSLTPYPASIEHQNGRFILSTETGLLVRDAGQFKNEIAFLQQIMTKTLGKPLQESSDKPGIEIVLDTTILNPEGYKLQINKTRIRIAAGNQAGIFYGIETLRQLLPPSIETGNALSSCTIPAVTITDAPKYSWRGMHLDVSRHFFSVDYLKRYIDLLALYKLNRLHLHLTDDQGWRMEIKKYPELTNKGAWRIFNKQDSVCMEKARENPDYALDPKHIRIVDGKTLYGGFYSQDQLRDLVTYARLHHVEIIPEIDMPGHMMAAITTYPQLSSSGKAGWGDVFSHPLDPGREEVYTFLQDVLDEVIRIFPSPYIHIGADEVEKSTWASSESSRRVMEKEGFKDLNQLQAYFVDRMIRYLESKGKKVVVWDDALEGGLSKNASVMYWRNWVAGVPEKVLHNGNKLIFTPGDPLYFSRMGTPLYDVYHLKTATKRNLPEGSDQIAGIQACVWSETVPSEKIADALIFPRVSALAERAWTSTGTLDWQSFKYRLSGQLERLKNLGVNYYYAPTSDLLPIMEVDTLKKRIGIAFESEKYQPEIHFTTDGNAPTLQSSRYKGEFYISGSATVKAAIFENKKRQDPVLIKQVDYHSAIGKKVIYHQPWNNSYPAGDAGALTDGLRGGTNYNDGKWQGFTNDLDVTVDMNTRHDLQKFSATFMQITGPGVYLPSYIDVLLSNDGVNFEPVLHLNNDISTERKELLFKEFSGSLQGKNARFIRVKAVNSSHGFLFVDELIIN